MNRVARPPSMMLRLWAMLDALEAQGLLAPDATFEDFEAKMARLEAKAGGAGLKPRR